MNSERKRQLRRQYQEREVVGGVYRIRNVTSGRFFMDWDDNLDGAENGFDFAVKTAGFSRPDLPALSADWREQGEAAFVFERLEELTKKPEQSVEEFREDLEILFALWRDKMDWSLSYKK